MMTNETAMDIFSQEHRIWFAVLVSESIVIFIINAYTLIVFARNRHLRKRSTYLIINLTVSDLLVGAVTEPLDLYYHEIDPGPGFSWQKFSILIFHNIFQVASLSNLCLISLERLHATLCPIRHYVIGKWVYVKAVICSWLLAFVLSSVSVFLKMYQSVANGYLWASYVFITFIILTTSYVIIIANIKSNPPPQHFGAVVSDRKLSVTLFMITVVSILTILPLGIYDAIPIGIRNRLPKKTLFHFIITYHVSYYANALVNPLIYASRMKEFRKAVKGLICKDAPGSSSVQPIELHTM